MAWVSLVLVHAAAARSLVFLYVLAAAITSAAAAAAAPAPMLGIHKGGVWRARLDGMEGGKGRLWGGPPGRQSYAFSEFGRLEVSAVVTSPLQAVARSSPGEAPVDAESRGGGGEGAGRDVGATVKHSGQFVSASPVRGFGVVRGFRTIDVH